MSESPVNGTICFIKVKKTFEYSTKLIVLLLVNIIIIIITICGLLLLL